MGELHLFFKAQQMRLSGKSEIWNSAKIDLSSSDKAVVAANYTQACDFTYVKCCFSFPPPLQDKQSPLSQETSVRAVVGNAAIHLTCL